MKLKLFSVLLIAMLLMTLQLSNVSHGARVQSTGHVETKTIVGRVSALVFANPLAVDMDTATVFTLTVTGDTTLNASNGRNGQWIFFRFTDDGAGPHTITFGTNFDAQGTLVTTASDVHNLMFTYDGTNWHEETRMPVDGSGIGLPSLVDGTANQVTVTNDGDGTITLSTPQNTDTAATITFSSVTAALLAKGNGLFDVKAYSATGDGSTDDRANINTAHTAATANGGVLYFPGGANSTYRLSSNITFDSDVSLAFGAGAKISVDNTFTATVNGKIEAGLYQIFSGAGTVTLAAGSATQVYPQWWGALGDNSNDDVEEITAAIDAAAAMGGGTVLFPIGTYKITTGLSVGDGVILRGITHRLYGEQGSKINFTGSGIAVTLNDASAIEYMNVLSADDGIAFYGIGSTIKECVIYGTNTAGSMGVIFSDGTLTNPAYYCRLKDSRVRKFKTLLYFDDLANGNWVSGANLLNSAGDGGADIGIYMYGSNGNTVDCTLEGQMDTDALHITGGPGVSTLGNDVKFTYLETSVNETIKFGQNAGDNIVRVAPDFNDLTGVIYDHHTAGNNKVIAYNKYQIIPTVFEQTTSKNLILNTNMITGPTFIPTGWASDQGAPTWVDTSTELFGYRAAKVSDTAQMSVKYSLSANQLAQVVGKVITAAVFVKPDYGGGSPSDQINLRVIQAGVVSATWSNFHTDAEDWEVLYVNSYIDAATTGVDLVIFSNDPGLGAWSFEFALPQCVIGTEIWAMNPRALTDGDPSIALWSDEPFFTLHNNTEEDGDGGREGEIRFKGEQSGGEITTLAKIKASHDGAADDEKGKIEVSINDGTDGDSPTLIQTIDSTGETIVGTVAATTVTGANVTSGADPGHTHTGASLGTIDISDDTNLAVSAPVTLTDDTVGITVAKDIVAGGGLTGGEDNVLPGADADTTITVGAGDGVIVNADEIEVYGLVASDGDPNDAVTVDATGNVSIGPGTKHDGYVIRDAAEVQTTDATVATLKSITLLEANVYLIQAWVTAIQSDETSAGYIITVVAKRTTAGSASIIGSVVSTITSEEEVSWDCTFDANGNDIRVRITGEGGATIEWTCTQININGST